MYYVYGSSFFLWLGAGWDIRKEGEGELEEGKSMKEDRMRMER